MSIRVAINGFGRIGRNFFRTSYNDPDIEIVALNDLTNSQTLAHLLTYDSIHGTFQAEVQHTPDSLTVNGKQIRIFAIKDPKDLPWKDLQIDFVIESTGRFTDRQGVTVILGFLVVPMFIFGLLSFTDLGERIVEKFYWNRSAQTRLDTIYLISHIKLNYLLYQPR